jgi:histidine phosphotransferase ChpT
METKPTQLAELVCTRISHDLIGNIGALSNMLEMLPEMDGKLESEDFKLMETAVQTLSARQQFFRLAFGCDTSAIDALKLRKICQDYLHTVGNRSFPLDFECNNMSTQMTKVLCLCLMIGAEVCLRGGHIKVNIGRKVVMEVVSQNPLAAGKIKTYEQILAGVEPEENVAQFVQLMYLQALLGKDIPLALSADEKTMVLTIG